jgi:hypothetical protein
MRIRLMPCAVCPECGRIKEIDASGHKNIDKPLTIEIHCQCGETYIISIERRTHYRKDTKLHGICANFDDRKISEMKIHNISRTGIGFTLHTPFTAAVGDILHVRFVLNGKRKTVIDEEVLVKRIDKDYIGARFRRVKEIYPELGYYLMQ